MTELREGDYPVAEGFTYYVSDRTIHVRKKTDRWRKDGDFRCLECKHRITGKCIQSRTYESFVCECKPKGKGLYYNAPAHGGKDCKMFEHK